MMMRINELLRQIAIVGSLSLLAIAGLIYSGDRTRSSAEGSARATEAASETETHWGYTGFEGPLYWGSVYMPGGNDEHGTYESYDKCLNGYAQSPISGTSLNQKEVVDPLGINPKSVAGQVTDNGHAVAVGSLEQGKELEKGSTLSFKGVTYDLLQLHFHSPSEHRRWINGTYGSFDPVEMHLVHKTADGYLAVVGVFITSSGDDSVGNSELVKIQEYMDNATPVSVDIAKVLPQSRKARTYDGSLTTPACSEGVKWFVMDQPIKAAPYQIDWLRLYYSNNSRGQAFEKVDGGLKQISSGEAGVWGVNSGNTLYLRGGITSENIRGTGWKLRMQNIKHVSSGPYGAWIVSMSSAVSHTTAAGVTQSVTPSPPNMNRISAGKYGVWAVDGPGNVFYRLGVSESKPTGTTWNQFSTTRKLKDIASGEFGVWGVDTENNLYFLQGSMDGTLVAPTGSNFLIVDNNISRVSSGPLGVWTLGTGGTSQVIKSRSGINAGNPWGAGWRVQDGLHNEISSGKYGVWGTNSSQSIYFLSSAPSINW